ncbi:MAG TPA: GNAT family N-acetyltransferase [Streptosporangiaceae bacterium]|nr:GNAT family N-acetyltransferase [Streptosporangiaceae bacterium]
MLREASDADRDMVLRWRNHPQVRRASFTTHEIEPDEHRRWWSSMLTDDTRWLLIYEHGNVPSGVVTFATTDLESANWGFYLDIEGLNRRGELLPAWIGIERESASYAFEKVGVSVLRGEVLASNTAVRRLHRRCGFTETGTYIREIDGIPREVVRVELRKQTGP